MLVNSVCLVSFHHVIHAIELRVKELLNARLLELGFELVTSAISTELSVIKGCFILHSFFSVLLHTKKGFSRLSSTGVHF